MFRKLNELELRSDEVVEILSKPPNWMIRWGSALLFFLIVMLLLLSWAIKYPDIVQTQAIVTTLNPPQKEFASVTGKLDSIYVEDSQIVNKNSVLAVLENSASTEDVYYLKSILDTLGFKKKIIEFPINEIPILILGDIETAYANFENSYTEYELNKELNPFLNETEANRISLSELSLRLQNLQAQYSLNNSELNLKQNDLKRNKNLLDKGVISQLDYENKQLEFLNVEKGLKNLKASISQVREAIANASKNMKGTKITRTREEAKLLRSTLQSYSLLKKAIRDWEQRYVLKSEIVGKVSFLNYWSVNQTVSQGDLVFTIIPDLQADYIAKLEAESLNSGKVKKGQKVNIKLENYPETEFGMLNGKITNISQTPNRDGKYYIDVKLPNMLITSYNREIEFKQEMRGTAEIITEDLRLIERFFYQFKSLFDN